MFERLKLKYGGVFSGPKRVEVVLEEDKLYVKVIEGFYPTVGSDKGTLAQVDVEEWTRKIHEIGIENWKERYQTSQYVADSKEWDLEYKDTQTAWLSRYGKNKYPDNWSDFIALMNEVAGRTVYKD